MSAYRDEGGQGTDADQFDELFEQFAPVSLRELDERAALLTRVDNKYAITRDALLELAKALKDDHEVLEIEDRRVFSYRTTYFDTPQLRCFTDHVEGRLPRFKARTRLYVDTAECVFEVKLKNADDETDKRQIDHPAHESEQMTASAERCLTQALEAADLEMPDVLQRRLHTAFHRITLGARNGTERITIDHGVRLSSPDGRTIRLRPGLVLVETKSEHGDSPADRELRQRGIEAISLSKYRVGVGCLTGRPQPGNELFT